ncbi:putative mediator of RNA polymerase II transcription subunit 26 isoform X3 [Symsagittifera roscoffensis]|uniref:putative mediator of RNA polymerase II transcription subunit 26 isoform X3 n=1 Tax=Symsagittifera roscoffensis TaxID=84072 RepID=UPI00307BB10D
MPVHSNPLGLESKTNGQASTVSLRIKIPETAVSQLESLAKKHVDNPLRKIGIVRVCVDGVNTIEIPTAEAPKTDEVINSNCQSSKAKRFSQALTVETNTQTPGYHPEVQNGTHDSSSASSNTSSSSNKSNGKKDIPIPRSKDVLPLGPSYIRCGAISPKPIKKKRDPSSHPPFDCDLPLDIPPPIQAPVATQGHAIMSQLTSQNGRLSLADQATQQSVISAAIIMSNLSQYEHAIEAVIHKAVSGQDLTCYLVEIDPTADLDSIPPATPKSVDLNGSEASNAVASISDQNDTASNAGSELHQQNSVEHTNVSQMGAIPPTPTQMAPPPPQTMSNPSLVVRTGHQQQVPTMQGAVMASPHAGSMGMHARGGPVWGYDPAAPSPHGPYILASPGEAAAMGFGHDPMAGRHPSPVKMTSPMISAKMPPQSPSYAPMMYGGHSPYGRMGPSQASPYGAPHPHTSPMSQFSPNFAMTSPIGPGGVMQPGMGPYGMIPQMGKTQAQMMQQSQQQHSPISSGVTMQQQQQQMLMPPTHSLAHSHGGQQQHQMSKDFLPSLQHSQSHNAPHTQHSGDLMMHHQQHQQQHGVAMGIPMTSSNDQHQQMIQNQHQQHAQIHPHQQQQHMPPQNQRLTQQQQHQQQIPPVQHSQQGMVGGGGRAGNVTIVSMTPSSEMSSTPSGNASSMDQNSKVPTSRGGDTNSNQHPRQNNSGQKLYLQNASNQSYNTVKPIPHQHGVQMESNSTQSSSYIQTTSAGSMMPPSSSSENSSHGKTKSQNQTLHHARASSVVTSGSLPFGSIDDDISSEPSPFPASPAPSIGSVKLGNLASSSSDALGDDASNVKLEDMNLSELDNATRKLLSDVVCDFEKTRSRSDDNGENSNSRMMTPVNVPTYLADESTEPKIVTEIRIPTSRSSDQVTETITIPKTVPVINTSANVIEKKEKRKRDTEKSKKSSSNADDKKQKVVLDPLRKFPLPGGMLDNSHREFSNSTTIDYASSFDSQTSSAFSSSFFGSNNDPNLFSTLEPDSLFNSHDFESSGHELMASHNFMQNSIKGDLEGVENDEHCEKLLSQILEGDGSAMPVSDFNDVLVASNSMSRSMSQPANYNGDNRMKGIHGISDSFGISENDINLLQQSMDMAQASSQSTGSTTATQAKPRKRTKSSNNSVKAFGEPNPKISSNLASSVTTSSSPQKSVPQGRSQVGKSATPTPATDFTPPGSGTPEIQLSKSTPESTFSSMNFDSVINKVLSEKSAKRNPSSEVSDPSKSTTSNNSGSPSYESKMMQSKYQESVQRVVTSKTPGHLQLTASDSISKNRLAGNGSAHHVGNVEKTFGGSESATLDFVNYASTLAMPTGSNNQVISDHQYIKQTESSTLSSPMSANSTYNSASSFTGSKMSHMNSGTVGMSGLVSGHSMDVGGMSQQQQNKFLPSLAAKSNVTAEYSSVHVPSSPMSSKYVVGNSGSAKSENISGDLSKRRAIFVPKLTNNNLITTATSATAGLGATKPPVASSNTPQAQFYSHHQTPINQNSPAKTLSPVTASSVTTSGGSSAGMSMSGGRVLSSLSGIPISGRNQIGFSSTGLTNHHVSSSTIHKQLGGQ